MEPTLRAGDWLLVDRDAYIGQDVPPGGLVVAKDPRLPERWIVKRAAPAPGGGLRLTGDHPAHAAEAGLEAVPVTAVIGRPWFRYWPPSRIGRVA